MNTYTAVLIFLVIPFALFVRLILGEILRVMPVSPHYLLQKYSHFSWLKASQNSSYWG